MMDGHVYDVCVVGAGMIGTAAAKYILNLEPTSSVLCIGPTEKQERYASGIHSQHYDEGRITRALDLNHNWGVLARRSLRSYKLIEEQSGVRFYHPVGFLSLVVDNSPTHVASEAAGKKLETPPLNLDGTALRHDFPYMHFRPQTVAHFVHVDGGHINPRQLVKAQKVIATSRGCTFVDDVVSDISVTGIDSASVHNLTTDTGMSFTSKKVLITTGCFTMCRNLLPANVKPQINIKGTIVVLFELSEADAMKLKDMPSLRFLLTPTYDHNGKDLYGLYALPPIRYPDGKYYLKVGPSGAKSIELKSPEDIKSWYREGSNPGVAAQLCDLFHEIWPDINELSVKTETCAIDYTPNMEICVDMVTKKMGVAIGGCGLAAKSSDEIGHMAITAGVKGEWDYDLVETSFKMVCDVPL